MKKDSGARTPLLRPVVYPWYFSSYVLNWDMPIVYDEFKCYLFDTTEDVNDNTWSLKAPFPYQDSEESVRVSPILAL